MEAKKCWKCRWTSVTKDRYCPKCRENYKQTEKEVSIQVPAMQQIFVGIKPQRLADFMEKYYNANKNHHPDGTEFSNAFLDKDECRKAAWFAFSKAVIGYFEGKLPKDL